MPSINKNLLPVKAHYFLYSGIEALRKMVPLIYRDKGVSNEVVGMVYSILTVLGLLITAFGGALADHFKIHRMMLILMVLIATIGMSSIYFLPELQKSAPSNAEEAGRVERSMHAIFEVEGQGILESGEMLPEVLIEPTSMGFAELLMDPAFLLLVICHACDQATYSLIFCLSDTLTFKTLNGESMKFGQQKMFSGFGLMINCAVYGYLVDWYSKGQAKKDLLPAFAICLALSVLDISVLTKWSPPESKCPVKVEETVQKKTNIFEFLTFKAVLFLVSVFVVGFAMNLMWVFKPLVADDIIIMYDSNFAYQKLLQGLMISMQALSSAIFNFVSGILIRKMGYTKVFTFGYVSLGLHFVIYNFISNPWHILPLELLHGSSYSLLTAAAASYTVKIAPPNALGSLQAIQQSAFSFGFVVAGFAGGYVYNSLGGSLTFILAGCFVFGFAVFYTLCKSILKLQERLSRKETNVINEMSQSVILHPTPPPSPVTHNKSIHLASLDESFMKDFKEIECTPFPKVVDKSQLSRTESLNSYDSGCYDEVIDSADNEVNFRSLTPRKSVVKQNLSVNMEGVSSKPCTQNKTTPLSIIQSVKKAVTLAPSFRVNSFKSKEGSRRVLPFLDSSRIPGDKFD